MWYSRLFTTTIVLTLCGCTEQSSSPGSEAGSRQLQAADPTIAAIYNRSCRNCHTVAATGAPLTGDHAAWAPRLDKGMNVLLDNVINGFGTMPPYGLCRDCDVEQLEALIRFMSTGE